MQKTRIEAFAQRTPVSGGPTHSCRDAQSALIRGNIVARKGDVLVVQ